MTSKPVSTTESTTTKPKPMPPSGTTSQSSSSANAGNNAPPAPQPGRSHVELGAPPESLMKYLLNLPVSTTHKLDEGTVVCQRTDRFNNPCRILGSNNRILSDGLLLRNQIAITVRLDCGDTFCKACFMEIYFESDPPITCRARGRHKAELRLPSSETLGLVEAGKQPQATRAQGAGACAGLVSSRPYRIRVETKGIAAAATCDVIQLVIGVWKGKGDDTLDYDAMSPWIVYARCNEAGVRKIAMIQQRLESRKLFTDEAGNDRFFWNDETEASDQAQQQQLHHLQSEISALRLGQASNVPKRSSGTRGLFVPEGNTGNLQLFGRADSIPDIYMPEGAFMGKSGMQDPKFGVGQDDSTDIDVSRVCWQQEAETLKSFIPDVNTGQPTIPGGNDRPSRTPPTTSTVIKTEQLPQRLSEPLKDREAPPSAPASQAPVLPSNLTPGLVASPAATVAQNRPPPPPLPTCPKPRPRTSMSQIGPEQKERERNLAIVYEYISNLKIIVKRELTKINSLRDTKLSRLYKEFRVSLNCIQSGMTAGYLKLVNNDANSKSIANQSESAEISLAVLILSVEQISEVQDLIPRNIINEINKLPIQFFENLEKHLNDDKVETVFNYLDTLFKEYSDKIEVALLKLETT